MGQSILSVVQQRPNVGKQQGQTEQGHEEGKVRGSRHQEGTRLGKNPSPASPDMSEKLQGALHTREGLTAPSVAASQESDKDGGSLSQKLSWKGNSGCAWEDGAECLELLAGN